MEAVYTAHAARREEAKIFTVKYRQQENGGGRGDHRGDEKRPGKDGVEGENPRGCE